MPTLAPRPITARAVMRGEKNAIVKEFDLVPVARADGGVAFTVKRSDLVPGVMAVEVRSPIATAKKDEAGFALSQRGLVFDFNKDSLVWMAHRGWIYMPYYAMKTPRDTFIAIMEGMRFEHDLFLKAENGDYAMYPSWNIAEIGFPPYEDMTVIFYRLPQEADYNEMAKVYRSYKFAHDPAVRTLKERIKERPELQTLADSIALRQSHASKPWDPKNKTDFTPETEPPIRTHRTYDETLSYLKQLKEAGVENVALCVAGWQTGGYDGRCPATFPLEEGPGGEAGIRRLCEGGRALGYIIDGHSNYTDCFTCSPLWDNGNIACLSPKGTREFNGVWSGGKAYNLCLKNAWETFLPGDLEKISKLGFRGCHYVDVFSAVQPYRCCNPQHPRIRRSRCWYRSRWRSVATSFLAASRASAVWITCSAMLITSITCVRRCVRNVRPKAPRRTPNRWTVSCRSSNSRFTTLFYPIPTRSRKRFLIRIITFFLWNMAGDRSSTVLARATSTAS